MYTFDPQKSLMREFLESVLMLTIKKMPFMTILASRATCMRSSETLSLNFTVINLWKMEVIIPMVWIMMNTRKYWMMSYSRINESISLWQYSAS